MDGRVLEEGGEEEERRNRGIKKKGKEKKT